MPELILFNKPFDVLSQFTDRAGRATLSDYLKKPGIYPAGRLDRNSEGLLLLTSDGALINRLTTPQRQVWKTYWVQVEGDPTDSDLEPLRRGIKLKDGSTRPAQVCQIPSPSLWPRDPPIRQRARIPTQWLEICIHEGRNRQVRRMTAAIGFPTLRLVRWRIGDWSLDGLAPGQWRVLELPRAANARRPGYRRSPRRGR